MKRCKEIFLITALSGLLFFGEAPTAAATGLNVFAGAAAGLDIDLSVKVDAGKAYFTFTNNSTGAASSADVHEIYFEKGLDSLLSASTYQTNSAGTSAGASFSPPASPPNPPSGNTLTPSWDGTMKGFGSTAASRLDVGETWIVWFQLLSSATTVADILAAVFDQKGTSRIALHIGTCPVSGQSCSATVIDTISQETVVPLPPALLLFGTALVGLTALGRRRKA